MHRISDLTVHRAGPRESIVTATVRSPELARVLKGTGLISVCLAWSVATSVLGWFAWEGGLGLTAHAAVRFCLIDAAIFWVLFNGNRIWQEQDRTTLHELVVELDDKSVSVDGPDGHFRLLRDLGEIRFSSRPHRRGKYEERDERHLGHPVGYAYRDGWEVWCEAGTDVRLVIAVSEELDARAIVRQLTDENLAVTRGNEDYGFGRPRMEPI